MKTSWPISIAHWTFVLVTPILLALLIVQSLIYLVDYPGFEYGRIEPDLYGFTPDERLDLAHSTLDYLRRPEPASEVIYLLEDLDIPGSEQSLYNSSEIGHMLDVKNVADVLRSVMWLLLIVDGAALIFLLWRGESRPVAGKSVFQTGLLTIIIVITIMVFLVIAWGAAFTLFHNVFFDPGTWQFAYTDSLIRLFPEQFWFDFALIWTGTVLLSGAVLTMFGFFLQRRAQSASGHK